jgi:hypothetical protein
MQRLNTILAWLEAHARWSQLKALGSSSLVKVSVLMPAFGYILLLNENVHQYLTVKYDGWLLDYFPSIWRVWLLFYGSFFLAIGTILYSAFCPAEVKHYQSAFEMADAEHEHQQRLGQHDQVRDNANRLYAQMTPWQRKLFPFTLPRFEDAIGQTTPLERISIFLVHHWTIVNTGKPVLRLVVLLSFTAGLTLLAVPAVFTFVQVTVRLFS